MRMISLISIIFAALPAQDYPARAKEGMCVIDEGVAQLSATGVVDHDKSVERCRLRYRWTEAETLAADNLAQAALDWHRTSTAAARAGVNETVLENIYNSLTRTEALSFGWYGKDTLPDLDPVLDRIEKLLQPSVSNRDQLILARNAVVAKAVMDNSAETFSVIRGRRNWE